jgi:hypothetical protein
VLGWDRLVTEALLTLSTIINNVLFTDAWQLKRLSL